MNENCLICNNKGKYLKSLVGGTRCFQCLSCGIDYAHGFESRSISNAVVDTDPQFYSDVIDSYEAQKNVAFRVVAKRVEKYENILGRRPLKILEVGCGTAAYSQAYLDNNIEYCGIELDSNIASFARKHSEARIENKDFLIGDIDNDFDVIFASQVFEHVLEPDVFLRKCRSILSDGLLHLDVPNQNGIVSNFRKTFGRNSYGFIQPPHHMIAYNEAVLKRRLELNNFDVIEIAALRNDNPVLGQLVKSQSILAKGSYFFADLLNGGSLLSVLAKP